MQVKEREEFGSVDVERTKSRKKTSNMKPRGKRPFQNTDRPEGTEGEARNSNRRNITHPM